MRKKRFFRTNRWMFLLVAYIFGYLFPLVREGAPNPYYYIPLKVSGLVFAIAIGNPIYEITNDRKNSNQVKEPDFFRNLELALTNGIPAVIILILFLFLQRGLLYKYGVDISPFIGGPIQK